MAAGLAQSGQAERIAPRDLRPVPTRRSVSPNAPQDELILSVETADAVTASRPHDEEHEEHKQQDRRRRRQQPLKDEPAVDLAKRRDSSAQRRFAPVVHLPAGNVHPEPMPPSTLDIKG